MSKKCTPLWREAHFEVKMYKTHHCRTTFGSWDVEKVHAVVARSTFRSQNVQNTPLSDHFWKLRCRKSARRCGAKHISKSKCTKHTTFGPLLELPMWKKCPPLWREAHFQVKMYKTHHCRTTFGSWDVEKVPAVVARSTFRSQSVQNTPLSDHFWKLRCRKSARRCGAKHISKSKCTKHTTFGPLLELPMWKKCTPLWREAHFQVKRYKAPHVRATFGSSDVEKVHAVVARSTCRSQNVKNTRGSDHFWRFRCRFAWQAQGIVHLVKSEQNVRVLWHFQLQPPLHYTPIHYTTLQLQLHLPYILLHYTPLHCTALNYAQLHYTTLQYTTPTLHYTTLPSTTLHYITLHYTPQHYNYTTTLHYTKLHYTTLHYTTLHYYTYITLHYTTRPSTTLHYITLHSTTLQLQLQLQLHSTTLHYIKLHYTTTLHYITLHSTTLHHTTLHYTTLHWMTLHHR